tara:strand:+ start:49 stop:537 length:489 start_codon:yes stop_codon:yes gene_type:complete
MNQYKKAESSRIARRLLEVIIAMWNMTKFATSIQTPKLLHQNDWEQLERKWDHMENGEREYPHHIREEYKRFKESNRLWKPNFGDACAIIVVNDNCDGLFTDFANEMNKHTQAGWQWNIPSVENEHGKVFIELWDKPFQYKIDQDLYDLVCYLEDWDEDVPF